MRTWLITGCSTGLGRAIAETVLKIGEQVVVTARNVDAVADIVAAHADRALALALDVTDAAAVTAAVQAAEARFEVIDVLVNNAGIPYVATIEEGDEAVVRSLFDVNFFGPVRIVKAVLPGMRRRRQGRIIQVSSLSGLAPNTATGNYGSTKRALEAMSESLAREVAPLDIKVTSIAPGNFRTEATGPALRVGPTTITEYHDGAHARMRLVRSAHGKQTGDPNKFASAVVAVADMADPPLKLVLGPDAYAVVTSRLREDLASLEEYRALSESTDFDT